MDLPTSGSFLGPKISRAMARMMRSSGKPIFPNMGPYLFQDDKSNIAFGEELVKEELLSASIFVFVKAQIGKRGLSRRVPV
jgi:hypothetical protein